MKKGYSKQLSRFNPYSPFYQGEKQVNDFSSDNKSIVKREFKPDEKMTDEIIFESKKDIFIQNEAIIENEKLNELARQKEIERQREIKSFWLNLQFVYC